MNFKNGKQAARKTYTQFRKENPLLKRSVVGYDVIRSDNGFLIYLDEILLYFKGGRKAVYNRKAHGLRYIKDVSEI